MTPSRVNSAHWPTKEHLQIFSFFCIFVGPRNNLPEMAPKGQDVFFLLIQTLPTFCVTRTLIFRYFFCILEPGSWLWLAAARGGAPVAGSRRFLDGTRTTQFRRSKDLGQDGENPISASPVWGQKKHGLSKTETQIAAVYLRRRGCYVAAPYAKKITATRVDDRDCAFC